MDPPLSYKVQPPDLSSHSQVLHYSWRPHVCQVSLSLQQHNHINNNMITTSTTLT